MAPTPSASFAEPLSPTASASQPAIDASADTAEKLKELANIVLRLERDEERLTMMSSDLDNQRKALDTIHKTIIAAIITLFVAALSLIYQGLKVVPDLRIDYARTKQAVEDLAAGAQADAKSAKASVDELSQRLWDVARGLPVSRAATAAK